MPASPRLAFFGSAATRSCWTSPGRVAIALTILMTVACGGSKAAPTPAPQPLDTPTAVATATIPTPSPTATPRPAPTPTPVLKVETPALIIEVLEGKLQYRTPESDWLDAIDGLPIQQG